MNDVAPQWTPDRPEDATSAIFQALGAASMCWETTPTGIFDSTRAKRVGDGLVAYLTEHDAVRHVIAAVRAELHHAADNETLIVGQGVGPGEHIPGVRSSYIEAALEGGLRAAAWSDRAIAGALS